MYYQKYVARKDEKISQKIKQQRDQWDTPNQDQIINLKHANSPKILFNLVIESLETQDEQESSQNLLHQNQRRILKSWTKSPIIQAEAISQEKQINSISEQQNKDILIQAYKYFGINKLLRAKLFDWMLQVFKLGVVLNLKQQQQQQQIKQFIYSSKGWPTHFLEFEQQQ